MSKESVATVRSLFNAYKMGDLAELEIAFAPGIVWLGAEPGTACYGQNEVIDFLRRQREHGFQLVLEETLDVGNKVLAVIRVPGIAALQGRERDERGYHVITLEGATISGMRDFVTREAALADLETDG